MRVAAVLTFVVVAVVAAGQAPAPRQSAPSSPTSGTAGVAAPPPSPSQTPSKDPYTAIIRGRVVRADNGQPLAFARVSIAYSASDATIADEDGRFELKGLPAGRHTVTAAKGGFVTRQQGPVTLTAGQTVDRIDFTLQKGGVISGVVLDQSGEPLVAAPVQLYQFRYDNDFGRRLINIGVDVTGTGGSGIEEMLTDDLGRFRLFGLSPGTYYVVAGPSNTGVHGSGFSTAWTLYPGTLSLATAQPITVNAGEEIAGLSFSVMPERMATIRGVLRTADGRPARSMLTIRRASDVGGLALSPRLAPDGSFIISNVPTGRHTLLARDGNLVAFAKVDIDGVDLVVPLTMSQGRTVRGRVLFESGPAPPNLDPATMSIAFSAIDAALGSVGAEVTRRGTFEASGLIGSQRLVVRASGWALSGVEREGLDITDTAIDVDKGDVSGLEISLTRQITTVTGRVRDERGQTVRDALVVMFADDSEKWAPPSRFIRTARSDQDGRFTLAGLPPARYLVLAVESLGGGEGTSPETLERLSRAGTRVTLGKGETRALDLRVVLAP